MLRPATSSNTPSLTITRIDPRIRATTKDPLPDRSKSRRREDDRASPSGRIPASPNGWEERQGNSQ